MPWAIALLASSAPARSPRAASAGPAPPRTAPRPAMMTGRWAPCSRSATAATSSARGAGVAGTGSTRGSGASTAGCACRSIGRSARRAGARSPRDGTPALRPPRRSRALETVSAIAPTERTRSCWSMRKFDLSAAPGVSPASEHRGPRLRRLGQRGQGVREARPLVHVATPTRPVMRRHRRPSPPHRSRDAPRRTARRRARARRWRRGCRCRPRRRPSPRRARRGSAPRRWQQLPAGPSCPPAALIGSCASRMVDNGLRVRSEICYMAPR